MIEIVIGLAVLALLPLAIRGAWLIVKIGLMLWAVSCVFAAFH